MITLYLYNSENGAFVGHVFSDYDTTISNVSEHEDFTLTPPPDYNHVWRWIEDKWVADEPEIIPIEQLQNEAWEGIKRKRLEVIQSGVYVESVDKVFHTDDISAIQYSTIAGMIALGNYEPIQWKVMDNTWVLLTESLFKELQTAMSIATNDNYMIAEQHKAAMMQSDDPLSYDYSEGWTTSG